MKCTGYISFFVYLFMLHKQVDSCDSGYWLSENNRCYLCPTNCIQCTNSTYCTKCKPEFWDTICGSYCHENCTSSGCSDTKGHCYGCHPGFYGTYCEQSCFLCLNRICGGRKCTHGCIEGYYEEPLSDFQCRKCHKNCLLCKGQTECLQCTRGFYLHVFRYVHNNHTICSECPSACEECISSDKCTACRPGKYGSTCNKDCNISYCKKCFEVDSVAKCIECSSGYILQQGHCFLGTNVCSQYCSTSCESGANCLGDCINGWTGTKCTEKCADKCRKCDQDDGTNCEICEADYYTRTCDTRCNIHCLTLSETVTCNINNGTCLNGCEDGNWGDKCEHRCNEGCNSVSCDRLDGHCDTCYRMYYGTACEKRCGDYCIDDRSTSEICNKEDGKCIYGCRFGNSGDQCNDETSVSTNIDISSATEEIGRQYDESEKQDSTAKLFLLGMMTGVAVCLLSLVAFKTIRHIVRRRKQLNGSRDVREARAYENTGVTMQAVVSTETEGGTENEGYIQTSNETSRSVYERLDGDRREDHHPYSGLERQTEYHVDSCDPGYWLTVETQCYLCPSDCEQCTNSFYFTKCKPEVWDIRVAKPAQRADAMMQQGIVMDVIQTFTELTVNETVVYV